MSTMLLVSSPATWSRTADIHARCNRYFSAFAAHFFFAAGSTAFKTPRLLWLALASQRLPVDEERTAARHGREERAFWVPRTCVDQRRSRPALSHTSCCSLLTWCSEQKSQRLSTQCFTRDTWDRVRFSLSLCRQLGTRLAPTVSTTSAPGRESIPPLVPAGRRSACSAGSRTPHAWSPW